MTRLEGVRIRRQSLGISLGENNSVGISEPIGIGVRVRMSIVIAVAVLIHLVSPEVSQPHGGSELTPCTRFEQAVSLHT